MQLARDRHHLPSDMMCLVEFEFGCHIVLTPVGRDAHTGGQATYLRVSVHGN